MTKCCWSFLKGLLTQKRALSMGVVLLCGLFLGGCSLFEKEKIPLEGKRISVDVDDTTSKIVESSLAGEREIILSPVMRADLLWLQDGRTASRNSSNLFLSPGPLTPAWSYSTRQEPSYLTATPIVTHDHVFLYHCGAVHCVDLFGQLQWNKALSEESDVTQFGGGMCSDGKGHLFITTPCCHIFCLSEKDGSTLWTQATTAPVRGAPVYYENYVCCLNMNNQVEIFDTKTGESVMDYSGLVEESRYLGNISPSISDDGIMVSTFSSGEVVALSLVNEALLWIKNDGKKTKSLASTQHHLSHTRCSPVINNHYLYTVTTDHYVCCYQLETGDLIWKCPLRLNSTPWISGHMLFCIEKPSEMGMSSWRMVALHADTGEVMWAKDLVNARGLPSAAWFGPFVANNAVYVVNNEGDIIAMDPTKKGHILSEYKGSEGAEKAAIAVAHGKIFLFNSDGVLTVWAAHPEKPSIPHKKS